jgi:hypothetical protein
VDTHTHYALPGPHLAVSIWWYINGIYDGQSAAYLKRKGVELLIFNLNTKASESVSLDDGELDSAAISATGNLVLARQYDPHPPYQQMPVCTDESIVREL